MDHSVPSSALLLLNFIGALEAPKGFDTIYGNNQDKLAQPLTTMTVDEVISAGPSWTKAFRSSAAGRYQFLNKTLKDLKTELDLRGTEVFDPSLQDRLAYHLLLRRGYDSFVAGQIDSVEFGRRLAQEWAGLPVLADVRGGSRNVTRGQSYYAGDGLNKSLVKPEAVEALLEEVKSAAGPPSAKVFEPARTATAVHSGAPTPALPGEIAEERRLLGWHVIAALVVVAMAYAVFRISRR